MTLIAVAQNTPEWLQMRVGCVTASKVADVVGRKKPTKSQKDAGLPGDYYAERENYLMNVVIERITGRTTENYVSPAMEWGIEQEPFARAAYEMAQEVEVENGGIAYHPKIEWFSASPDGLVGEDGLVEIKCPNTSTHLAYLLEGELPLDYMPQMLAQMLCTERKWCDFVSYDPRLPANLRFFCRRFHFNEEHGMMMEKEVEQFLEEVVLKLGSLAQKAGTK